MSKAIYEVIGGEVYKLMQSTTEPTTLSQLPTSTHTSVNTNTSTRVFTQNVSINTMEDTSCLKSNKELCTLMLQHLRDAKITEVPEVADDFQAYIDYTLCCCCDSKEHQVSINPMQSSDSAILLGVGTNNELVYRRIKKLTTSITLSMNGQVPIGIMKSNDKAIRLVINDIGIFQNSSTVSKDLHNSIYCTPYRCGCAGTVNDALSAHLKVFSLAESGMSLQEADVAFTPAKIVINIEFILGSVVVVYDESEVNQIIEYNIANKYHPTPDPTPDTGDDDPDEGQIIPKPDKYPDADGDETPNEDGWFDYYQRCLSTSPYALLVVEDLIPDNIYDEDHMIKKKKVIKDIPDITIGEYVKYFEAIDESSMHGNGGNTEPSNNTDPTPSNNDDIPSNNEDDNNNTDNGTDSGSSDDNNNNQEVTPDEGNEGGDEPGPEYSIIDVDDL